MPALRRKLILSLATAAILAGTAASAGAASASAVSASAVSASAATPHASRHFAAAIEDYAAYVPQTSCDPHVKKGTAELARLLARTYRGTTWASAYACGTDGTPSEHYEGRAIDWMVSARNAHTKAEARAFYHWLFATDRYGNTAAMARRLGVMYVIFNNRIWGSWDGRWQQYDGCKGAKKRAHSYDNACHRTHMHISLSWNGARGKTSFWTGHMSPTDYGPCVKKGHKYAPKWTHANLAGCPS